MVSTPYASAIDCADSLALLAIDIEERHGHAGPGALFGQSAAESGRGSGDDPNPAMQRMITGHGQVSHDRARRKGGRRGEIA